MGYTLFAIFVTISGRNRFRGYVAFGISFAENYPISILKGLPVTRVFISYSHDSDSHRQFVADLSAALRQDGLDCLIDQYITGFPPEGWQRWMESEIEQADRSVPNNQDSKTCF